MIWIIPAEKTPDGKLVYDQSDYDQAVQDLPFGELEILIGPPHKELSEKERRYYWPVIVRRWAKFYGVTNYDSHEMLLVQCAPRDEQDRIVRTGRRQTESDLFSDRPMNHAEYHDYVFGMNGCREFVGSKGCWTPDPNRIRI